MPFIHTYTHTHTHTHTRGSIKSKGKKPLTAVTVSNFYISFCYTVPLQYTAVVLSFNEVLYSCREEAFWLLSTSGVHRFLHFLIGRESPTEQRLLSTHS
jgi:hypothetical protein